MLWLNGCRDCLEIVGNAQHAAATTRRNVKPGVLLVVPSTLSTHAARRGRNALDREIMTTVLVLIVCCDVL